MLSKAISGGQSGIDQAGLRAARAAGLETGGFAPEGWQTEDGPAPWLADYGLEILPGSGYPGRTRANVRAADAVLLLYFGERGFKSPGTQLTITAAHDLGRPIHRVDLSRDDTFNFGPAFRFLAGGEFEVIDVAGNRASKFPGIGERAEAFLTNLFREVVIEQQGARTR